MQEVYNSKPIFAAIEILIAIFFYYLISWQLITHFLNPTTIQIVFLWIGIFSFAFYILFISAKIHNESLEARGLGKVKHLFLRTDNFLDSAKSYLTISFLILTVLLIMTYIKFNSLEFKVDYISIPIKLFFYFFSAFAQDVIFFSFLLLRIYYVVNYFSPNYTKILTLLIFASFFSLFHYPNLPLCILSFFFSFILGFIFFERRNLFWVVLIHAFVGTYLHRIYQLHMKIGILYESEESFYRKIVPGVEYLIGNAW